MSVFKCSSFSNASNTGLSYELLDGADDSSLKSLREHLLNFCGHLGALVGSVAGLGFCPRGVWYVGDEGEIRGGEDGPGRVWGMPFWINLLSLLHRLVRFRVKTYFRFILKRGEKARFIHTYDE